MNAAHLALCGGTEWAAAVQRWIVPSLVDGLDLGDDVLELGPGPGATTDVLVGSTRRLTAVELDAGLAAALAARHPDVTVVTGDARATGLPTGRFSAVVALTMLHHLPSPADQDALFAEARRVLAPGGVFAGEDSLDGPEFRALHEGDTCTPVPPDTMAGRLTRAGFATVEVRVDEYAVHFCAFTSRALSGA